MIIPRWGDFGDWHILVVEDLPEDDDDRVRIYHPGCTVRVETGKHASMEYTCGTQHQLNEAGYYGMFHKDEELDVGVWLIRPWVEKIVGPTWTEWDGGWHVEPFGPTKEAS